ncbi:MAG: hypothetical protein KC488_06620 [Candidatus Cloacimonetes bacterium]|nr:hypothetical protein [Candidatus Cloacimonadota bacterium]
MMRPDTPDELDRQLRQLFSASLSSAPPQRLRRMVAAIPANSRLRPAPRPYRLAPLVASVTFLLLCAMVLGRWLSVPGAQLLKHLPVSRILHEYSLLPSPSLPGLWIAAICAATLTVLGLLASHGEMVTGGRLRRD